MSIGVFDSGVGGLTVLKEIRKVLPNEKIYYLGDTARVPYGEKTKDLIIRYSKQIVEFLLEKKVSAIVVACNTATSLALDELNDTFKTPIIGVIDAGVKTALYTTKNKKIGVIGTKATINSKKYEEEIKKKDNELSIELSRTKDILKELGEGKKENSKKQFLCGFSMETENMEENSKKKLKSKNVDMIVANNVKVEGAGFGTDTNVVTIYTNDKEIILDKLSKLEVAKKIFDEIVRNF